MDAITNDRECFVRLWREVEETRRQFYMHHKRFCVRRVLQRWFPEGIDIAEVCFRTELQGYDELPDPALYPRPHRELIRGVVSVVTGTGMRQVKLKELDAAYSEVFSESTPININKKGVR